MDVAIEATRDAFIAIANGAADVPQRHHLKPSDPTGDVLVMSGWLPDFNGLGLKVVSVYPNNPQVNLPATLGAMVLLDPATGQPNLMMDATFLTAIRTGAASGLATDVLANPDADTLGLLGTGGMARHQLEAVCHVRTIRHLHVWSRTYERAVQFVKTHAPLFPDVQMKVARTTEEAVKSSLIVTAATSSVDPIIMGKWLNPGTHVNLVGSHSRQFRELDTEGMYRAEIVAVDAVAAAVASGDIATPIDEGKLQVEGLTALGSIILGHAHGRKTATGTTVFKSVGLAAQDLAVGMRVYELARQNVVGTTIGLLD